MKLYLSSYGLGNKTEELTKMVGENKRTAVITNALDFSTDSEKRTQSNQRVIDDLKSVGFQPEFVDLRDYFGKPEELDKKLSEFGLIWVRGGNAFLLRRAFKESGMDQWLLEHKKDRELVYGGFSAGVCVLAPSLKGLELVDDPNVTAKGYKDETIWEGLGLINFAFVPHYMSNHPESEAINSVAKYYVENAVEHRALRDGEVIIQEIE